MSGFCAFVVGLGVGFMSPDFCFPVSHIFSVVRIIFLLTLPILGLLVLAFLIILGDYVFDSLS